LSFTGYSSARTTLLTSSTPSNISEAFGRFLSNLELTDTQGSLVADRHNALRERILQRAPFKIDKTVLYGSYERSSQIRPRPTDAWTLDVDIFVIMANQQADIDKYYNYGDGGQRLLDHLKTAMDGFQGLEVEKDAPAVCVKWRTQKMKAEVTPAFKLPRGFAIPNSSWFSTTWKVTDPIGDSAALTERNKATNGSLKPFIKAMKCWNRKEGRILSSYAVETAAYHSIGTSFVSLEYELILFFQRLLELNGQFLSPPSGIGDKVKIDFDWDAQMKIETALSRVRKAYSFETVGRHRAAIEEMAIVFGQPFPLAQAPGLLGLWS
jgi:hypothetical protein